ncbi:hypothetical protein B0H11DRAFT_1932087 [Mycena galericulata]|nr:hypothetical protein B0H11DRAFT_1935825 [Mycena galericulata]KAJ7443100.1 hypothetical protein B0H11DRAFT_1932087 [Mycena galericulata]
MARDDPEMFLCTSEAMGDGAGDVDEGQNSRTGGCSGRWAPSLGLTLARTRRKRWWCAGWNDAHVAGVGVRLGSFGVGGHRDVQETQSARGRRGSGRSHRLSRRIDQPRVQIQALLARRHAFKCEGPGVVYINSRVPYQKWNQYLQEYIPSSAIFNALEVKVGHTRNMARRQSAYRACTNGIFIRWHVAFRVRKRILTEAIVHLLLRDMGAVPSVYPCPGCGVSHREYVPLRSVGSFDALERVVRKAIRMTGQLVVQNPWTTTILKILLSYNNSMNNGIHPQ